MVAEESRIREAEAPREGLWCYLVSLGGRMFALPDDDRTVLLPFITGMPTATPLPVGLAPPYVMGLINVSQRGEMLVDLPRLLDLRDGPLGPGAAESQRVVVVGETMPPETDEYRLAFAIDYGYELLQAPVFAEVGAAITEPYIQALIETPRGEAALLDLEAICNTVLHDLGAERRWNQPSESLETDDV
ncbi:MAG TPA: chemotaxis protein CheW [Chloroflexota bacterium]|nr:chemotaxis protein CheW [Chloroflexota bacterium]